MPFIQEGWGSSSGRPSSAALRVATPLGRILEAFAVGRRQAVQVQDGEIAHDVRVHGMGLGFRRQQEVRRRPWRLPCGRRYMEWPQTAVADGALLQHEGPDRLRQNALGDGGGGFVWVEGDHDVDLAVRQQLAHGGAGLRKLFALAPHAAV